MSEEGLELKGLQLEVVTPRRNVFEENVKSVVLPGLKGELEPYAEGLPLLTSLRPGRMICRYEEGDDNTYYLGGGFAEVLANRVVLLADECIKAADVDVDASEEELEEAKAELHERRYEPFEDLERIRLKAERANARILVAKDSHEG